MKVQFKGITRNKESLHVLKYVIEEQKGDAQITSTICIILEDTGMTASQPLDDIIPKGAKLASEQYKKR
jgi:hypothetical protein